MIFSFIRFKLNKQKQYTPIGLCANNVSIRIHILDTVESSVFVNPLEIRIRLSLWRHILAKNHAGTYCRPRANIVAGVRIYPSSSSSCRSALHLSAGLHNKSGGLLLVHAVFPLWVLVDPISSVSVPGIYPDIDNFFPGYML